MFEAYCSQVSLAAVSQICVIHEDLNGCKNLDSLKDCFENVNIYFFYFSIAIDNKAIQITIFHTSSRK